MLLSLFTESETLDSDLVSASMDKWEQPLVEIYQSDRMSHALDTVLIADL